MAENSKEIPATHGDLELLTAAKVAKLVGRSTVTLERWRRLKKGPPYIRLSGARVAYPVSKLREWLATGEVAS